MNTTFQNKINEQTKFIAKQIRQLGVRHAIVNHRQYSEEEIEILEDLQKPWGMGYIIIIFNLTEDMNLYKISATDDGPKTFEVKYSIRHITYDQ